MNLLDIFQKQIDGVSAALMANDFAAYFALVETPLAMISDRGLRVIEDESDFRFAFENYAGMLKTEGATDLIRLAHAVSEYGPDLMTGRYETHILRKGQRIYGPFQSAMTMRRVGDGWKINSIVSPTHGERWRINVMRERPGMED